MSFFTGSKKQRMKTYFLYLISFFSFFYLPLQAQKAFEINQYTHFQDEIRRLASSNPDSALIVAKRLKKSIDFEQKIFAKGSIAFLNQIKGDTVRSNQEINEAIRLSAKIPNSEKKYRTLAYLNNYMGVIDRLRGKLSSALLKLNKGLEFSKKANDIIQVVKMEMNIAGINYGIGNYKLAIKSLKNSEKLIQKNNILFNHDDFFITKSNLFSDLGVNYEALFKNDTSKVNRKFLDSAMFFYKKAIPYSKHAVTNKIKVQNNIALLYTESNKIDSAVSIYQNVLVECKENNLKEELYIASYNLGYSYFVAKKYEKSLVYFNKVDSLYNIDNSRPHEYTNSKYYQSKIYEIKKDYDKAIQYASIYLKNFEKNELKLTEEKQKINSIQNNFVLKNEMQQLHDKYATQVLLKKLGLCLLLITIALLIFFVVRGYKLRKTVESKFNDIMNQYKKIDDKIVSDSNLEFEVSIGNLQTSTASLNLDVEKEIQLLNKLKELEEKEVFLNQDFTLQFAAKKIKTNTTYLSYVVNKNFQKTFSEYANELKINYVVAQMIKNSLYRKYSTQAIAESVGYKNATSFARSFNKKTGLSPVQFAQKLDKLDVNDN